GHPVESLSDRHEAAREDARGPVPDRRGGGARSPALPRPMGERTRHRRVPLWGRHRADRLLIPEKLYGREREIETLLASFDRVLAPGAPRLLLVCGRAGIGKSSVVNELHKALVPSHGLVATGKCDQLKRDIPYASLAQALRTLIRRLLSMPEAELSKWGDDVREALDPNGAPVVDLIPELKFIVGEQPTVGDVPAHA